MQTPHTTKMTLLNPDEKKGTHKKLDDFQVRKLVLQIKAHLHRKPVGFGKLCKFCCPATKSVKGSAI